MVVLTWAMLNAAQLVTSNHLFSIIHQVFVVISCIAYFLLLHLDLMDQFGAVCLAQLQYDIHK